MVSAGRDLAPKTWDAAGNPLKTFPAFAEPALHAVFTHDGARIVAADWSGQVRVFNVADGTQVGALAPNPPTLAMLVEQLAARASAAGKSAEQAAAALAAIDKQVQEKTNQLKVAKSAAVVATDAAAKNEAERAAADKAAHDAAVALKALTEAYNAAAARWPPVPSRNRKTLKSSRRKNAGRR